MSDKKVIQFPNKQPDESGWGVSYGGAPKVEPETEQEEKPNKHIVVALWECVKIFGFYMSRYKKALYDYTTDRLARVAVKILTSRYIRPFL